MNILVIGGSVFVGKHIVEAALSRGHQVTVFNRGSRQVAYSQTVEHVQGDRTTDLHRLQGQQFDSVVDCCAYTPEHMAQAVAALQPLTNHYVFISTISVYQRFPSGVAYDETAAVAQGSAGYGALKARAEELIEAGFPGRVAHVRPGLIVGPDDPSGRFAYWPVRVAAGGAVLAAPLAALVGTLGLAGDWCRCGGAISGFCGLPVEHGARWSAVLEGTQTSGGILRVHFPGGVAGALGSTFGAGTPTRSLGERAGAGLRAGA